MTGVSPGCSQPIRERNQKAGYLHQAFTQQRQGSTRKQQQRRTRCTGGKHTWVQENKVGRRWEHNQRSSHPLRPAAQLRVEVVGSHQQLQRHLGRHLELGDVLAGRVGVAQLWGQGGAGGWGGMHSVASVWRRASVQRQCGGGLACKGMDVRVETLALQQLDVAQGNRVPLCKCRR